MLEGTPLMLGIAFERCSQPQKTEIRDRSELFDRLVTCEIGNGLSQSKTHGYFRPTRKVKRAMVLAELFSYFKLSITLSAINNAPTAVHFTAVILKTASVASADIL